MSKTFRNVVAFALMALALSASAQEAAPAPAPAPAEPFTVTLPDGFAAFTKQSQTSESPDGKIETTNWISKNTSGEAVVVTLSKMPGKILDGDKMISSTRESLMKSLNATAETDPNLFRGSGAVFRSHYIVSEDRLFQLLYVGRSDEQRNAATVGQLFESFKLQ